jgi:hypothetical protein
MMHQRLDHNMLNSEGPRPEKAMAELKRYIEGVIDRAIAEGMDELDACERVVCVASARRNKAKSNRPMKVLIR